MKTKGPREKLSQGPGFFEGRHIRRARHVEPDDPTYFGLLAVLHHDGGHYVEEHGAEKATRDAIEQWLRDQRELEELRRRAARVERSITWGEVREATDSTWAALDLAEKLILLGFFIEDFPGTLR